MWPHATGTNTMSTLNHNVCLQCKITSQNNDEIEYHEIFDEIGLELNLPSLVKKFFKINVNHNLASGRHNKQVLCDDCVNRLIELFDLEEHNRQTENSQEQHQESEADPVENIIQEETVENNINNEVEEISVGKSNAFEVKDSAVATTPYSVDEDLVENTDHQFYTQTEEKCPEELELNVNNAIDEDSQALSNDLDNHLNPEEEENGLQEFIHLVNNEAGNSLNSEEKKTDNCEYEEEVIIEEHFENEGTKYYQLQEVPEESRAENANQDEEGNLYYEEYDNNDGESMDVVEENTNDFITIDEEYLIEEAICSEEYDNIDLNEYLDNAIITKFEELDPVWVVDCKLCLETFNTFQNLLRHNCIFESADELRYCCIIKDCDQVFSDLKYLARHLLTFHYDNTESLAIYGRCPECQKTFSNIVDFNKHSCCLLKRRPGIRHFCQACNMDFQSQKRYVFHMQFHLTKHRPKICLLCCISFNNVTEFFEHVSYGHELPTTMACKRCDRFFSDKTVYDRHIKCHESKILYDCSYCPKTYTNRCGLASHMDIYHFHKTKPLQCEYCNKEFVSQSSYRSHLKVHMPEANVPAFVCSMCGLVSNCADTIKNHIETDEDPSCEIIEKIVSVVYTCENCSFDFDSTAQLHQHRQSAKHDGKLFYCPICRKAFRTLQHMRNHLTSHKNYDNWNNAFPVARFYMCDIGQCRDAYPLWTSLYYHKKRHKKPTDGNLWQEENIFKCQFCDRQCPTKMSLAIHVARVHNNSHVKCPHCKKMYKTKKDLQEHIDFMHTSIQCPSCERVFKSRRNLRSHEQLVHANTKRYFCNHCPKGYYYKSERDAHEKNVHPDVSLNCGLCHFITNYPKSLEIHMAKHNDKLPFKCSTCGKTFGRKQLLLVHEKRHQKEKDFICQDYCENGCKAAFITLFLLKKHIQRKHPETVTQRVPKHMAKRSRKATGGTKKPQKIVIQDDNNCVELIVGGDVDYEYGQEADEDMEEEHDIDNDNVNEDEEYDIQYEYEDENVVNEADNDELHEEHVYDDEEVQEEEGDDMI